MRWQPAHLSGVAPLSMTCGPPSARAVPPPVPMTASNAMATPATPPSSTAFFILPPDSFGSGRNNFCLGGNHRREGRLPSLRVIATYCTLVWHLRHIPRLSIFTILPRSVPGVGVTLGIGVGLRPPGHGTV